MWLCANPPRQSPQNRRIDSRWMHLPSIFAAFLCVRAVSAPSAKGRNRFFITAAAKRMRGVFFPMCKTRARSMAGLASRAFGGIRRFHVPLQRKVGGAKNVKNPCTLQKAVCNVRVAVIRLHNAGPKEGAPSFQSAKTVRPVFRGDTVWLILFLVLRLIQGAAQPFHGRTRAPYRASRCIPARSQKPQRRCSCIGACRT